jgi:hypothetical protein
MQIDRKIEPGSVAFIFMPVGEGMIKITTSKNPERLARSMREECPSIKFELVGAIALPTWNKAVAVEQRVRRELAPRQDNRFWYKLTLLEAQRLVQLVQADVDRRAAAGPQRLDPATKATQEAEWHAAGAQAYRDGQPFTAWPRIEPKYCSTWYRAKRAWQDGWNEASQQSVNTA